MTVNVLGQTYEILMKKQSDDPKLDDSSGYIEPYSKKLVIDDFEPEKKTAENSELFKQKVLRHEIVHAFLYESGLCANSQWADNEEMVDWIAIQIPKMIKAMQECGAM